MRRIVLRSALAGMVAALSFFPGMAHAQTQSTTCSVVAQATFDPGLTFTTRSQTVTVRGRLSSCVGGGVTDAVFRAKGTGQMSCLGGSGSGRAGFLWNTDETSVADITVSAAGDFTGMVTSGLFAGEPITGDGTATPGPGDCLFRPIKSATLSGTISL